MYFSLIDTECQANASTRSARSVQACIAPILIFRYPFNDGFLAGAILSIVEGITELLGVAQSEFTKTFLMGEDLVKLSSRQCSLTAKRDPHKVRMEVRLLPLPHLWYYYFYDSL